MNNKSNTFNSSDNNEIRKFTAYCGLWCKDCIPGNNELFEAIEKLEKLCRETGLDRYAAFKSKRNPVFEKYPAFIEMLGELKKLRCSGSCYEGPRSELGCTRDCKIRQCVLDKNYDGCWECGSFHSCELIRRLHAFHPGAIHNLETIKAEGIQKWHDKRGRHYNW